MKRAKFSLTRKGFDDLIERIENSNNTLSRLIDQSNSLEPSRPGRHRHREALFFKEVQQYAKAVFDAVSTSLKQTCQETHNVSLHIFPRRLLGLSGKGVKNDLEFPVVISHKAAVEPEKSPILWSEIKLRHVVQESSVASVELSEISTRRLRFAEPGHSISTSSSRVTLIESTRLGIVSQTSQTRISQSSTSSTSIASLTQVDDLCHTLRAFQSNKSNACIGLLSASVTTFQILPSWESANQQDPNPTLISLRSVLNRKDANLPALLHGDKLRVAVAIASSVLQLHNTHWLERSWSKNDVFFIQCKSSDTYKKTFISRALWSSETQNIEKKDLDNTPLIRNTTLFSLGILLIELCLNKPLEQLRTPEDTQWNLDAPRALTDIYVVHRILKSVQWSKQASFRYQSATKRCIYCNFDQENASLDDDGFRQAVYDMVVAPLEQDLLAFEG
jgi:hypothetical protein